MSTTIESGRILITATDGTTRLDTNEDLFHIVSTIPEKTFSIAQEVALETRVRFETDDYVVGSCNADCTHVIGAVFLTGTGTWGAAFSRWTTYMGGTLVWAMTAPGTTAASAGNMLDSPRVMMTYEFIVSGSQVIMRRRLRTPEVGTGVVLRINAHTIKCKMKAGLFS